MAAFPGEQVLLSKAGVGAKVNTSKMCDRSGLPSIQAVTFAQCS